MPGLRKIAIAEKVYDALRNAKCSVVTAGLVGEDGDLPWECKVTFPDRSSRLYRIYFWTVSHGGRGRSQSEYRVQAKLKTARKLNFASGTTLLLGYYDSQQDQVGRDLGNSPAEDMELFVAWDPLQHLQVGASSSCQVPFPLLQDAYLNGSAVGDRRTSGGSSELVIVVRPELLWKYFVLAAGGHNSVDSKRFSVRSSIE